MEITWVTFVTLSVLLVGAFWFAGQLLMFLARHDGTGYSTLDEPLKNRGKPWHNK